MENPYNAETGCCPRFDPHPWDHSERIWQDKLFITDRVKCVGHIPLNFGPVIARMMNALVRAGAMPPEPPIMLCDESSFWHTDIYLEAAKQTPDSQTAILSGRFLTKVFDGPYRDVKKFYNQMADYVKSKGLTPEKLYAYYAYCPKCAKHYGKNYIVMVARA